MRKHIIKYFVLTGLLLIYSAIGAFLFNCADKSDGKKADVDKAFNSSNESDIAVPKPIKSKDKAKSTEDDDSENKASKGADGFTIGDMISEPIRTDNITQQIGNKVLILSRVGQKEWMQISGSADSGDRKVWASLAIGEWDVAAAQAKEALSRNSADPQLLSILVASLLYGRKIDLALYYLDVFETLYPKRNEIFNYKGLSIIMKPNPRVSDLKKAENFFKRAFNTDPDPIAAGLNLGYLYLEQGNAREANRVFATLLQRSYEYLPIQMGYGISYCRMGQYDRAKEVFEKILAKKSNYPIAMYYQSLVHWKGYKNVAAAKDLLQKLMTENRDPVIQEKAQKILEKLK